MWKSIIFPNILLLCLLNYCIPDVHSYPISGNFDGKKLQHSEHSNVVHDRQRRSITRFHDTLIKKKNEKQTSFGRNKTRRNAGSMKRQRIIPADDSLRQQFFSEQVENALGNVKLNYRLRRNNLGPDLIPTNTQYDQSRSIQQPPASYNAPYSPPAVPEQNHYYPAAPSVPGQNSPIRSLTSANTSYQPYSDASILDKERVKDLEEIMQILARRDGLLLEQMLSLRDILERFYGIFEFMGVAKMPKAKRDAAIRKILQRSLAIDIENAVKRTRV